jgi:hypothetical protein
MTDAEMYTKIEKKVREWVEEIGEKADKPIFGHGHQDPNDPSVTCKMYTARDILREIEQHTKFGENYVHSLFDMALDHIINAPTKKEDGNGESNHHDQ